MAFTITLLLQEVYLHSNDIYKSTAVCLKGNFKHTNSH